MGPGALQWRDPASWRPRSRRERSEVLSAERERCLRWAHTEDGTGFELEADLPADRGAVVAKALARLADQVPIMPDDGGPTRSRLEGPMPR